MKISHLTESCSSACSDLAKGKKSELRLYCDLLMQQIHSIKEAANGENGPDVNVYRLCLNTIYLIVCNY